jgi:hypothetical protein
VAIKDDFEATPVGQKPMGAAVNVENKGDSIAVTDEIAAGGSHSLKITDAPGLQNAWNPHLVYSPNHASGTTRCAFDLRIGPGGTTKTFDVLRTGSNAFERITWLGFSSNATAATVFYLDNIEITNQS